MNYSKAPPATAPLDYRAWSHAVDRMDADIVAVLEKRNPSPDDVARGLVELAKLKDIDNPNYRVVGVAAAYAWRYLALRTTSIVASFELALTTTTVRRVLDLGGGSGAGLLAVTHLPQTTPVEIVLCEPSQEMRTFAEQLRVPPHVQFRSNSLGLSDLSRLQSGAFDLVLLSTCFDYCESTDLPALSAALAQRTQRGSVVIGIEPPGEKSRTLHRLHDQMRRDTTFHATFTSCNQYRDVFRQVHRLRRVTSFFRKIAPRIEMSDALQGRIGLVRSTQYDQNWSYIAKSWHEDMHDSILIAQRV